MEMTTHRLDHQQGRAQPCGPAVHAVEGFGNWNWRAQSGQEAKWWPPAPPGESPLLGTGVRGSFGSLSELYYSNPINRTEGHSLRPPGEWTLQRLPSNSPIQEAMDTGQPGRLDSLGHSS